MIYVSVTDIRIGLHSLCTIARLIGSILIGFITDMRIGLQSLCTIALQIIANFEEKFLYGSWFRFYKKFNNDCNIKVEQCC